MPISAVFLGKISIGYTVRETLNAVFVIPSLFSVIWMALFSETSIHFELNGAGIYAAMQKNGIATACYQLLEQFPLAFVIIPVFILTAFVSYVTSANSNIHAMSSLCTTGLTREDSESPLFLKVFWGVSIGILCIIMLNAFGMDGMKMLADAGGFLSAFLMIFFLIGMGKILRKPADYDCICENYDGEGKPVKTTGSLLKKEQKKPVAEFKEEKR